MKLAEKEKYENGKMKNSICGVSVIVCHIYSNIGFSKEHQGNIYK
jgi:hypothetical protein